MDPQKIEIQNSPPAPAALRQTTPPNPEWMEKQKAFQQLEASEEGFRLLVDNVKDYAIVLLDPEGKVVTWNEGARRIKGYDGPEIVGKPFSLFFIPEDQETGKPEAILRKTQEEGRFEEENWRVRKDGSRFWADAVLTALKDPQGRLRGFAKITRDITERMRAEERLKDYSNALERNNHELQDFVFVASHDLQEPLRKVIYFSGFLQKNLGERLDPKSTHYLDRIVDASQRMQALILDLLTLTRVTTKAQPFTLVSLSKVLGEALSDLEIRISETGAQVEAGPLPDIEADPVQMRQLFQNLAGNALKFKKTGEAPRVTIRAEIQKETGPRSPGRCLITVADQGIGFEDQYSEKIFKVFERLHGQKEYPGSGIGLSVCKKIVERHGGTISARGKPGEGAVFTVSLPLSQGQGKE